MDYRSRKDLMHEIEVLKLRIGTLHKIICVLGVLPIAVAIIYNL